MTEQAAWLARHPHRWPFRLVATVSPVERQTTAMDESGACGITAASTNERAPHQAAAGVAKPSLTMRAVPAASGARFAHRKSSSRGSATKRQW
jgi:hypothetical protein